MLSTIKFFANANQIHKFKTWEEDSHKLHKLLEKSNASIKKYESLVDEENLSEKFEFVNVSIDDLADSLEFLPIFNINNYMALRAIIVGVSVWSMFRHGQYFGAVSIKVRFDI